MAKSVLFPLLLVGSLFTISPGRIATAQCVALVWSPDGREVACIRQDESNGEPPRLIVLDVNGAYQRTLTTAERAPVSWSPDSARLVYVVRHGDEDQTDLFVVTRDGRTVTQITDDTAVESDPQWSPNGQRIAYVRDIGIGAQIWAIDPDGDKASVMASTSGSHAPAWSPTGARLAFVREGAIYIMPGAGGVATLAGGEDVNATMSWSPDGARFAYLTSFEGVSTVTVIDADGGNPRSQSVAGEFPRTTAWAGDGQRLLVISEQWWGNAATADTQGAGPSITLRRIHATFFRVTGAEMIFLENRELINFGLINLCCENAAWSPDGAFIVAVKERSVDVEPAPQ